MLIRNLDPKVLAHLKGSAKAHGRSLQAEIHARLARSTAHSLGETRRLSAQWLKRLRHTRQDDSTDTIRQDRDAR